GTVDVDRDVLAGVLRLEMEQLGDGQIGDLVVDRGAEKDDSLAKQVRVDVGSPLSTRVLLDHHRDQRAHAGSGRACVEEVGFSFSNSTNFEPRFGSAPWEVPISASSYSTRGIHTPYGETEAQRREAGALIERV